MNKNNIAVERVYMQNTINGYLGWKKLRPNITL